MGTQSSESEDSDGTANVDELAWSKRGLAVGDARSGDCTGFGDCGGDGGDESDFDDGEDIVSSGELEGCQGGLGVCGSESEGRTRLGSCAGGLETVDGRPVDSRCELEWSGGWLGRFGGVCRRCEGSEKWEKAQPGASNEVRETGEVVREGETEGFVGVRNKGDNERLEGKSVLGLEDNELEL